MTGPTTPPATTPDAQPRWTTSRQGRRAGDGFHTCQVDIDRARGTVTWHVDGSLLHQASGLEGLPTEVHLGLGLFTLLPLDVGVPSVHGQGGRAWWRNVRHRQDAQIH